MKFVVIFSLIFALCYGNTGPAFQISDGVCYNATAGDLVFEEHHHKLPIPFVKREVTSNWAGDGKIYCVLATSPESESIGSTVEITKGGVNHSFVTLDMVSKKSHGFEYFIKVYAH
ncbi:unnamed protein product [Phyllotreta striolata]|uniref:Uncharacterized protein n=1 Tax=Phyllotreta striolata TaxID=444603 RepID=A0A9N9TJW0_PHYSR|nr:unnamed protein product [Phyllotreta striolata]